MDPTKKALQNLKSTARGWREENMRSRLSAADEDDDMNELTPSEPPDMKNPDKPIHFLEELPMPKKGKKK